MKTETTVMHRFVIAALVALVPVAAAAKGYAERMTFTRFSDYGEGGCDNYILAQDVIDADAPSRLAAMIDAAPKASFIVAFDSPGGNLSAGMERGWLSTRRSSCSTNIARVKALQLGDAVCGQ